MKKKNFDEFQHVEKEKCDLYVMWYCY